VQSKSYDRLPKGESRVNLALRLKDAHSQIEVIAKVMVEDCQFAEEEQSVFAVRNETCHHRHCSLQLIVEERYLVRVFLYLASRFFETLFLEAVKEK